MMYFMYCIWNYIVMYVFQYLDCKMFFRSCDIYMTLVRSLVRRFGVKRRIFFRKNSTLLKIFGGIFLEKKDVFFEKNVLFCILNFEFGTLSIFAFERY